MGSLRKPAAMSDPAAMVSELVEIADYISHLRREIAALRANELTHDRIPMAHEELGSVLSATAGATNTIMEAAEAMLALPDGPGYRANVEAAVGTIFEACAFQDITGQRIGKVVEALRQFELRLARFASAVKARDAAGHDPTEAERRERAERLLLNGPQVHGPATAQDDIDALFA
ncbi:protein phosphatase CheZ [uncultured Methylobacterium sp.]|uniref:protein phosphatase CheZ n=1 Tax=uncultured Methylobacterium sp. TaxID=157278 RepID=UPI0035CA8E09